MPQGFKLNRKAFRELRKSEPVLNAIERHAQAGAQAAGPGHEVDTAALRNRGRAGVHPSNPATRAQAAADPAGFVRDVERGARGA